MAQSRIWAKCNGCGTGNQWMTLDYIKVRGWDYPVWVCNRCGFQNSEKRLRMLSALEREAYGVEHGYVS